MASNQLSCQFANLETDLYPPRYRSCQGDLVAIEECQRKDDNGYSESSLILSRSGFLNHDEAHLWYVCEKHRRVFGIEFVNELRQKKCLYPHHEGKQRPVRPVSWENSRDLLTKKGLVVPYEIKVCVKCAHKISEILAPVENEEPMDSTPSTSSQRLYVRNSSDTPGSSSQATIVQRDDRDVAIELIQMAEPEFDKKKAMWKAKTPINLFKSKQSKYMMRKSVAFGIKAVCSAFTSCKDDLGEIYVDVKDSGFVEKALGQKVLHDSYIKEIIRAYNMAPDARARTQILSLVSKMGYGRLKKFNPPMEKKAATKLAVQEDNQDMEIDNDLFPVEHDDNDEESSDDESSDEESNTEKNIEDHIGDAGDVTITNESKKESVEYWNPPITWYKYKNARVHYDKFKAGGQPVEVKVQPKERIDREVLGTIIDFLTSDEQQQDVAFGTISVKASDGRKVKIARAIRRQHNNALIRQVTALLKENGMKAPAESTLRALFKLVPAGCSKDIKGLDPVYENHRRAFKSLQKVCTKLHDIFLSTNGDERIMDEFDINNIQLLDKVQQGLKICESYILGYFIYNVSFNSKCQNHCVTFACSDPNDRNFQEDCSADSLDESEDHAETCDYCNLLPILTYILDGLIKKAPIEEELCKQVLEYDMDKAKNDIALYKKQVFRHYVGTQAWEKYFLDKINMAMATTDWGMKVPPETHRETTTMWYGKVRNFILPFQFMIICNNMLFKIISEGNVLWSCYL